MRGRVLVNRLVNAIEYDRLKIKSLKSRIGRYKYLQKSEGKVKSSLAVIGKIEKSIEKKKKAIEEVYDNAEYDFKEFCYQNGLKRGL